MRRLFEKLWLLGAISLTLHVAGVAVTRRFVPPPPERAAGGSTELAEAAPAPPLVRLEEQPKPVEREPEPVWGETDGEGRALNSVDLPDEARSEKVEDVAQAWTSRQPVVAAQEQPDQNASKSTALVPSGLDVDLPAMSREQIAKGESAVEAPLEDKPVAEQRHEGVAEKGEQGEDRAQERVAQATPETTDPAPQGASDSDQFADAEGVTFAGGMKARKGRELKIARPRIDLAFRSAFTRLAGNNIYVGMRITTDAKGHPSNVEVLHSSGSRDIDESVKLAMYSSWFGGKMPDRFLFSVGFRD